MKACVRAPVPQPSPRWQGASEMPGHVYWTAVFAVAGLAMLLTGSPGWAAADFTLAALMLRFGRPVWG